MAWHSGGRGGPRPYTPIPQRLTLAWYKKARISVNEAEVAARLHHFLLVNWARTREVIQAESFTVCLHPSDVVPEASAALPSVPLSGELARGIGAVRESLRQRGRHSQIVFYEAFAPRLAPVLQEAGFVEAGRELVMVCTRTTLTAPAPTSAPPGLQIEILTAQSSAAALHDGWNTNELGFSIGSDRRASDDDIERFRRDLVEGRAFVARLDGAPAAAGMFLAPHAGVTELVGIATLEPFRRRGIAAALTAHMTACAMRSGCDLVYLRPADDAVARVYARVGFMPCGHVLSYVEGKGA
jgi:GNAT superfamily N-acetyltransferase